MLFRELVVFLILSCGNSTFGKFIGKEDSSYVRR